MSFERPLVLVALIAIPLLVLAWRQQERRRARQATAFSQPALIPNLVSSRPGLRRCFRSSLLLAALCRHIFGTAKCERKASRTRRRRCPRVDISRSR